MTDAGEVHPQLVTTARTRFRFDQREAGKAFNCLNNRRGWPRTNGKRGARQHRDHFAPVAGMMSDRSRDLADAVEIAGAQREVTPCDVAASNASWVRATIKAPEVPLSSR